MNKRTALIVTVLIIAFAAVAIALFFLRPMQKVQMQASPANNAVWKLERIQGIWTSEDEAYSMEIDGYDCALKIDGVYTIVASFQFDASQKPEEENARFTLQIDPSSVIYPDADGAAYYEMDALRYENSIMYMSGVSSDGVEAGDVCLFRVETALPT